MKKKCSILLTVLTLALACVFLVPHEAEAYEEGGFTYRVSKREATITKVSVEGTTLSIPDQIGGFKVTGIAGYAFRGSQYERIVIPETVKKIGSSAFSRSKNLKSIQLPSQIKEINDYTFYRCSSLTEVKMGSKITSIGEEAFANCIKLKKITIPNSVKRIDSEAFANCYKLSSVKLGRKVKTIGSYAFYQNYDLKSITLWPSVKSVETGAFLKCSDLANVTFKNQKTKLENRVFEGCSSLKKMVLPKKIKTIPEETFKGCSSISKVVLPKHVSIVKKKAFAQCRSLKKVQMNSKVYAIGDGAFANSGLKTIRMNSNMQFIGNGAFRGTDITSVRLGNKVTFIGNKVFANCQRLKTITIPASVRGINVGAFNNCSSLAAIHVAPGNANYSSQSGVLYNKDKSRLIQYPVKKRDGSFSVPGSVGKIRDNAFAENPYLKRVTIHAKEIGSNSFADMENLQSVTLNGVTKIGYGAFSGNSRMTTVNMSSSVTTIGGHAFQGTAIRTIQIPSSLSKIGSGAFDKCYQLSSFTGGTGGKYRVESGVLYNAGKTKLLKYPAKKADSSFTPPATVREIASYAFDHTSKLHKLYLGKNFRSMNYAAIREANNLKSVVFEAKKLGYISSSAIEDCYKLAVIVGPNTYGLRSLARNANATLIAL